MKLWEYFHGICFKFYINNQVFIYGGDPNQLANELWGTFAFRQCYLHLISYYVRSHVDPSVVLWPAGWGRAVHAIFLIAFSKYLLAIKWCLESERGRDYCRPPLSVTLSLTTWRYARLDILCCGASINPSNEAWPSQSLECGPHLTLLCCTRCKHLICILC